MISSTLPEDACTEDYGEDDRCVAENHEIADGDHLEGHVARQDHNSIGSTIDSHEEAEPRVLCMRREAGRCSLPLVKATCSECKESSLEKRNTRGHVELPWQELGRLTCRIPLQRHSSPPYSGYSLTMKLFARNKQFVANVISIPKLKRLIL